MCRSIPRVAMRLSAAVCLAVVCLTTTGSGQQPPSEAKTGGASQPAAPPSTAIVIADEPKTIDPAALLPAKLAAPVTVRFQDTSLTDVVKWIRDEQKVGVMLDTKSLAAANILLSEPVSDRLDNSPLYLLLDRLCAMELGWYMEDGMLHVTTSEVAAEHMTTVPYNLGDLIDAGYDAVRLTETITTVIDPTTWDGNGGPGGVVALGDVLFVRNSEAIHRQVAGLLAALRKHGRRTLIADAPQHDMLRKKLDQPVTVSFHDMPFADAIAEIARKAQVDIRLDHAHLREAGVRERIPASLDLADQKLRIVLGALLREHSLTWILRDGVLWITSQEAADHTMRSAVYDVRDLCRDEGESNALEGAIESQSQGPWDVDGGIGSISFPRPGVMVVSHTEDQLAEVLTLLENYRTALRASKPRKRDAVDPKEVVTRYYRVQTEIVGDLVKLLKQTIQPQSWNRPEKPDAPGTIEVVTSTVDLLESSGRNVVADKPSGTGSPHALVVRNSVLIVRQMREVHESIAELIDKIEHGDVPEATGGGFGGGGLGGGGLGGGGFGGGFFSMPSGKHQQAQPQKRPG